MKKNIWFRLAGVIVVVIVCLLASLVIFLRYGVSQESKELRMALDLAESLRAGEAEAVLERLAARPLGKLRSRLNMHYPQALLLRGSVLAKIGRYDDARESFAGAVASCESGYVGFLLPRDLCREIKAEAFFRHGDTFVLSWDGPAFARAVQMYKAGLRLRPDDVDSKRTLEWLLFVKEELEKVGLQPGRREISRGKSLGDLFGTRPKSGDGGGKAERGY